MSVKAKTDFNHMGERKHTIVCSGFQKGRNGVSRNNREILGQLKAIYIFFLVIKIFFGSFLVPKRRIKAFQVLSIDHVEE